MSFDESDPLQGDDGNSYANVREILGALVGRTVVDITQHDREDWEERRECFINLHFDDGHTLRLHVGDDGFDLLHAGNASDE